ncbi:MAG: twin-arginine translocation pathway signal protein [Burkholderiales bacterium]|nr:twin-arginine translocation pathway signal protein [Burkholderiales bacterium]
MNLRRRHLLSLPLALAAARLPFPAPAAAQTLQKNARILLGFPAGGSGDTIARALAEKMRGIYAPQVVIENRPGAGGRIAAEALKGSEPDGSSVYQCPASVMMIYPHVYTRTPYDPLRDFIPVTTSTTFQFSLTAGPGLPADIGTLQQYLAWAKQNPKGANYGSPSAGSMPHFAGVMLGRAAGVALNHVGYKGGAPLQQDLLGGHVPVGVHVVGEALANIAAGKLRSLATFGAQRNPFLPSVPTLAESGLRDLVFEEWVAYFVPARTPAATVSALHAGIRDALAYPDVVSVMAKFGLTPRTDTPEGLARALRAEHAKWGAIVKSTGFTSDD